MKTKVEIIKETVEHYAENPRGIDLSIRHLDTRCMYYNPDNGAMCSVGRCLISPETFPEGSIFSYSINELNEKLKEEYRGHTLSFWTDLQDFHDISSNWRKRGQGNELTEEGNKEYQKLLKRYEE